MQLPHRKSVWLVLALAAVGCTRASTPAAPSTPRNLIWVVVDTLRADHVSSYGGNAQTPNIDRLAKRGVLFRNAYATVPVTGPSHSTMFTGLLPTQHQVRKNTSILDAKFETLAESLKQRGYSTAAVVSLGVMKSKFGVAQGFDVYNEDFQREWFRRADVVTDAALAIHPTLTAPYFLFVHYSDPHEPYTPPGLAYPRFAVELNGREVATCVADGTAHDLDLALDRGDNRVRFLPVGDTKGVGISFARFETATPSLPMTLGDGWNTPSGSAPVKASWMTLPATLTVSNPSSAPTTRLRLMPAERLQTDELRRRYALEVEYTDLHVGRLLSQLETAGAFSGSVVVLTADHGEGLGDHGAFDHKQQIYNATIRVPLMIVAEGEVAAGREVTSGVDHTDLTATLRELLDLAPTSQAPGRSLLAVMTGTGDLAPKPLLAATFKAAAEFDLRSVVFDHHKAIRNLQRNQIEFYDLRVDPNETNDLAPGLLAATPTASTGDNDTRLAFQQLEAAIDRALKDEGLTVVGTPSPVLLSDEERAQLKALGYVP